MAHGNSSSIALPAPVSEVARRFTEAGGNLFVVGGWLRDRIRGAEGKDVDLATDLPASETRKIVDGLGSVFAVGERFGTIGLLAGGFNIEITTLRADSYTTGSRHPEVEAVAGIEEDLSRRDFTINAMARRIAPERGPIIDPFGGRGDLDARLIRTPGPPAPRMAEDPLRMMRAVRFSAQLGFEIDNELLGVLSSRSQELDTISWERRRDELERIITSPHPDDGIRLLVDTGLMEHVCPEISAMKGVGQPEAFHRADVLGHALLTMMRLEPDPLLRRAALLHDVGKPAAKTDRPGVAFPGHEKVGARIASAALKRLRYGATEVTRTVFLVRRHMRPLRYRDDWSDAAVRRLIRDCELRKNGEVLVGLSDVFALARADVEAGALEKAPVLLEVVDRLEKRIAAMGAQLEVARARSPLDGVELMELAGRPAGPWIRSVKEHLTGMVVDGELAQDDKARAREMAMSYLNSHPEAGGDRRGSP